MDRKSSNRAVRKVSSESSLQSMRSESNPDLENGLNNVLINPPRSLEEKEAIASPETRKSSRASIVRRLSNTIVEIKKNDELYAVKALSTPANFLKWFFRFILVTSSGILGVFVGQQIGCVVEKHNRCNESAVDLLRGHASSIAAWIIGLFFSAIGGVCAKYLWSKIAHRVEDKFDRCQQWAIKSKCRVFTVLAVFYSSMIAICGVCAVVIEKYGEGKTWDKNDQPMFKSLAIGCSIGLIFTIGLLLKPLIKLADIKNCCTSFKKSCQSTIYFLGSCCRKSPPNAQSKRKNSDVSLRAVVDNRSAAEGFSTDSNTELTPPNILPLQSGIAKKEVSQGREKASWQEKEEQRKLEQQAHRSSNPALAEEMLCLPDPF